MAVMDDAQIRSISAGLSQKGVRDHNERLILSLLHRHGALPGSDLARLAGLSPPTVSGILRSLEADHLLERGEPVRGKVGKPSIPMQIAPNGAFSYGLKIGRRSADLLLLDFAGVVRDQTKMTYQSPEPEAVIRFVRDGLKSLEAGLAKPEIRRICGIGIAAPFELWNWSETIRDNHQEFRAWADVDVRAELGSATELPVLIMNDATAACQAEQVYGRGKQFRDYAYFFVASYVGGGVVLNHSLFEGRQGNAGALGSLRSVGPRGESRQLVDMASIHLLETRLQAANVDPTALWNEPQDWSGFEPYLAPWLDQTAEELARASLSACSVIDFEAVLIDGAFPATVRDALVKQTRACMAGQDLRGLLPPRIEAGSVGGNARAIGAASSQMFSQFLLDTNAG